jgi:hypothetical protein
MLGTSQPQPPHQAVHTASTNRAAAEGAMDWPEASRIEHQQLRILIPQSVVECLIADYSSPPYDNPQLFLRL